MLSKFILLMGVGLCTLANVYAQTPAKVINGSPYLDEKYAEGVISFANKSHTVPVRYNAYSDLIEYQQNGKAMVLDPGPSVQRVQLGATTFVAHKYQEKGKAKHGYFIVLDSGKVTLFAKKRIIFLDTKKGGALDGSDQPAQYKRSADVFYYKVGDGELQEVESMKEMIASFPDKKEELTQYAKKEKISPRKEKEIIQFVQYYNSL